MFTLTDKPINPEVLRERLTNKRAGAFTHFTGIVRDHNHGREVEALEYEAYTPICTAEAQDIFREARTQFDIIDMVCVHRTGRLEIGESAVWIGVISAHRDHAFKACRYVIDELKQRLPIWKKEYYTDGESSWVGCACAAKPPSSAAYSEQRFYSRQAMLDGVGLEGQMLLREAKVCVIGAGGLGCAALTSLASAGVGTLGICEGDVLEESNLHRQSLYAHGDIGQPKALLAKQRLEAMNPYISVIAHAAHVDAVSAESILASYDVICDCTDNFQAKFLLNDFAVAHKKPLIQASLFQHEGYLRVIVPGQTACLRCLWPDAIQDGCVGTCADGGVLGPVPQIFGHWQALEVIKTILDLPGRLNGEALYYDALNMQSQRIKEPANPDCPCCGRSSARKTLINQNIDNQNGLTIDLDSLTADVLDAYIFVDIRESFEHMLDPVDTIDVLKYPLSRYAQNGFPCEDGKLYVFFCAKGIRSLALTRDLHSRGVTNVLSLNQGASALNAHFKTVQPNHT